MNAIPWREENLMSIVGEKAKKELFFDGSLGVWNVVRNTKLRVVGMGAWQAIPHLFIRLFCSTM